MKKRRPNLRNHPRSLRHSPRLGDTRASDSVLLRSKSSQDLKRKKLYRNAKQKQQSQSHGDEPTLNKNVFDSLESLFDVKKYPNFLHIQLHRLPDESPPESLSSKYSDVEDNFPNYLPHQFELEVNISPKRQKSHSVFEEATRESNSEIKMAEEESMFSEIEKQLEKSDDVIESNEDNVSINEETVPEFLDVPIKIEEQSDEEKTVEPEAEKIPETTAVILDKEAAEEMIEDEARPPQYPIPPGMADGVAIQPGQHPDSLITVTDADMAEKISEAREKCRVMEEEINAMKREVAELQQKEDLTDEDKLMVDIKSQQIMNKMAEMDEITRKVQGMLGCSDPTSEEFAKAFEMYLEAPLHHREQELGGDLDTEKTAESCRELVAKEDHSKMIFDVAESLKPEEQPSHDDQFDLPSSVFPEDRLPRVIVCGYTEDNLPKIVVADSKRKPRVEDLQHIKAITGKLTEALNMQEKLIHENVQIENSKYKLQEALLEKDNAVDVLQRKVCGLQREMQILMKENEGLSRQLAIINERLGNPALCQGDSPRFLNKPTSSSPRREAYKCCCRGQPDILQSQSACVTPRSLNSTEKYTLRFGGGGSYDNLKIKNEEMCCKNPATSPRSTVGASSPRGPCPAEIEDKLNTYETSTKQLEQQLGCMESEVKNMKAELANVQRERQQLEQQRKLLKCTGPCAPCPCPAPQDVGSTHPSLIGAYSPTYEGSQLVGKGASNCPQQQLRDLREQYARLQEDYKNKLCEVSCLRTDAEKIKQESREAREAREKAENRMIDLQERLKKYELERGKFGGSREQMIEDKHRLMVAEQRHREALEELEELRLSNQEYLLQLEDYRNKYLKAQEIVEEQARQLDLMEMDNARMNENVTLEIGRVKNQFQEKLAELAPLPEILKQTQLKLQEALQMRAMSDRNCEEVDRELLAAKDKIGALSSQVDILRSENTMLKGEKGSGSDRLDDLENKNSEFRIENERLKNAVARLEERETEYEEKLEQKMHEIVQLSSENEQVRQDAARQVARTKERCENIRRTMQEQIADMEKQLAQCRAIARAAQKDRDEIRQKMQGQINRLSESFEQAQGRIRALQGHVNYLKTSYSNVFNPPGQAEGPIVSLAPENMTASPYDACDCAL